MHVQKFLIPWPCMHITEISGGGRWYNQAELISIYAGNISMLKKIKSYGGSLE